MNYQFLILQAIAIILVVIGHIGGLYLLTDWFPAYSFHMPLFIFISGYFYKFGSELDIIGFIKYKVKKLIIPFFLWNFFYGLITSFLLKMGIVNFGSNINFQTMFIEPWITNQQYGLNTSSWFVLSLFLIQISYVILLKVFEFIKFRNKYLISIIIFIIGILGTYLSKEGYNQGIYLTIIRVMFLLPFYSLGSLYRIDLEKKDKINNSCYFIIIFTIQAIMIKFYGDLEFSSVFCHFNGRILLPYITSMTGIMLWLRISKILEKSLKDSKIVKLIGKNTWSIMMHHQLCVFMVTCFIYIVLNNKISGFNFEAFKVDPWYVYNSNDSRLLFIYAVIGIIIPISIKIIIEKLINTIKSYSAKNVI